MKHLFVYGTLTIKALFEQIVTGEYISIAGYLYGYQRYKVIDEVYPALLPTQAGDQVNGLAYLHVSLEDLERLDKFEGDMYQRVSLGMLTEFGKTLSIDTYICKTDYLHRVSTDLWNPADFKTAEREQFLNSFPGWGTGPF